MFCGCNDHRTENVILINWHDWPELLPGQVQSGMCRKQSSHVAKGKEMPAEGGSPWDRTVTEEACDKESYVQISLHVFQESCAEQQARETKTGTKEHGKTA